MAKHDLSKAQEVRSAEHAANTEQIADSTGAIEAVADAINLGEFLKNALATSLISRQKRTASEAKTVEKFKSFKTDTEVVLMQLKSKLKDAECAEAKETLASAEALDTPRLIRSSTQRALISLRTLMISGLQSHTWKKAI